ncbi:MAG: MFS transporter, partial [Thermomicrobiales bacterium]
PTSSMTSRPTQESRDKSMAHAVDPGLIHPEDAPDDDAPKGIMDQLRMINDPGIQELLIARVASKLGLATLSYGGMVYLARQGANEFQVVLVGSAGYIASLIFGLQGGVLADVMSKRTALALGLFLQAAACFLIPWIWGTSLISLITLVFVISAISQLTGPAMKSAVRLVTSAARVASVAALISLAGSTGSALGSSVLAPLIIRQASITVLMWITGLLLLIAAAKAISLPKDPKLKKKRERRSLRDMMISPKRMGRWATTHPAVASMVLVGALVVALFETLSSLLPVYVREVLHTDPTLSIYIFAPAAIGFLIGTVLGPLLIRLIGERLLTVIAMLFMVVSAILFGFIYEVAPSIAHLSPLGWFNRFDRVHLSDLVLAAGVLAVPMNFGSTAAGAAVQAYINRITPIQEQGSTFGIQEVTEQALTVVTLLSTGLIANVTGTRVVFAIAPMIVIVLGTAMVRHAYRVSGTDVPERLDAARSLLSGHGIAEAAPPPAPEPTPAKQKFPPA